MPSFHVSDDPPSFDAEATFVAHNAESFDAEAWERFVPGPQPNWYDSMHACRAAGLPAGLDRAARAIGVEGKKEGGREVMALLCQANHRGEYPVGTIPLWQSMIEYNIQDVLAMKAVYEYTAPYLEQDVAAAHCEINSRGIPVDRPLLESLNILWQEHRHLASQEVSELTDGEIDEQTIGSPAKMKAWLRKRGVEMPSLARPIVEAMLADPEGFFGDTDDPGVASIVAALRMRQSAIRATPAKVQRAMSCADSDDRVRGQFVYCGAHTGRFSGRDMQPHNLPRGLPGMAVDAVLAAHDAGSPPTIASASASRSRDADLLGDALGTLMRPAIRASPGNLLVVVDYSSIEARGIAWIAGDDAALDVFRDPSRDPYCEMASTVYGRPITKADKAERQLGKIIELACGYQMGAVRFGVTAKLQGVNLAAVGTTAEDCVSAYRTRHDAIARAWRLLYRAALYTVETGRDSPVYRCRFERVGGWLEIVLPSRRRLRYRDCRMEMRTPKWGAGLPPQRTMVYDSPRGHESTLYGGLLAENIVQAIARDIMVDALVRLDDVVMHVHDEIVGECAADVARARLIDAALLMSTPPEWAADFPLRVQGNTTYHYGYPAPGQWEIDAMRGETLRLEQRQ